MEHHGAALHLLTKDAELVRGLKEDYLQVKLDEKTKAILDYAVKLTIKPHSVKDEDVQKLKNEGCSDLEILDVCQITSYFNYVNRMAEGLGVKLEDDYK
ncbi:peroxidase [Cytobacillus suaedae]|nr:peroxidase [Cytobacillus suaedae]